MCSIPKLAYTIEEASEAIGVCKTTMYKMAKQPGFPAVKVGKKYLIHAKGLEEWLSSNSVN